ncbi:MAG: 16S rRNA processing protein RimM [Rickettsiales bacterium]|nr:16S rRNA processing protein RimM [Rickettsiales bacterium]
MNNSKEFVAIGKISSAHGISGHVKIFFYNDSDSILNNPCFFKDKTPLNFSLKSVTEKFIIVKIDNIKNRDEAEKLKNKEIFIELEPLESSFEYYFNSLIGLDVKSEKGEKIGVVTNVENYGASDLIEIKFNNAKTELFNFSEEIFKNVNLEENYITFTPPEII